MSNFKSYIQNEPKPHGIFMSCYGRTPKDVPRRCLRSIATSFGVALDFFPLFLGDAKRGCRLHKAISSPARAKALPPGCRLHKAMASPARAKALPPGCRLHKAISSPARAKALPPGCRLHKANGLARQGKRNTARVPPA